MKKVVVVGGGICGLSSAFALKSAMPHLQILIVSERYSPNTTSDVAGGLWLPYASSHPKCFEWSLATRRFYSELGDSADFGVGLTNLVWYERDPEEREKWMKLFPDAKKMQSAHLPPHALAEFYMLSPIVETPKFMGCLMRRLKEQGVRFDTKTISSLDDVQSEYQPDCILNCAGLGARELANDPSVFPLRGILLRFLPVSTMPLNTCWCFDDHPEGMSYVFQRNDGVWVGGVAEPGASQMSASPEEVNAILSRAKSMCPYLNDRPVSEVRVGLRPGRDTIRLELDTGSAACPVVHNYGHGGSGWTVMWGCAEDVVNLVGQALSGGHGPTDDQSKPPRK